MKAFNGLDEDVRDILTLAVDALYWDAAERAIESLDITDIGTVEYVSIWLEGKMEEVMEDVLSKPLSPQEADMALHESMLLEVEKALAAYQVG